VCYSDGERSHDRERKGREGIGTEERDRGIGMRGRERETEGGASEYFIES
jgi:hypothetical protein